MFDRLSVDRTPAGALAAVCFTIASLAAPAVAAPPAPKGPEPVRIEGYADDAMEPFLSRDGKFLFFNTRNDPGSNTNIHVAEATDNGFVYRGVLHGTISFDLDAVPTMAADGRFCFVSPRDYRRTRVSVLCGAFDGTKVNKTAPQVALATDRFGRIIFDVELSADGKMMIYAEGGFSGGAVPDDADLHLAMLGPNGYERLAEGKKILANVNTSDLEYAPALSQDGLELFFTRPSGIWPFSQPKIFRATRTSDDQPFARPVQLKMDGFVEGPTLATDGTLYFHKRVGGRFQIWRQPR
jgi:hypothetical protein